MLANPHMYRTWQEWASAFMRDIEGELSVLQQAFTLLEPINVGNLPSASQAGLLAYCIDESGGPVPVFSDGTNWRRVTDRVIVS